MATILVVNQSGNFSVLFDKPTAKTGYSFGNDSGCDREAIVAMFSTSTDG